MRTREIKKLITNILIIIFVLLLVLYFSLKDNYQEIISYISNMNLIWFGIAILFLVLYRLFVSISSYNMIKINNQKIKLLKVIQINFIILFFNGITPFSGGGQPMEIYFLHNEKIKSDKSANIVLQNFIVYQTTLVIMGIFAIVYNNIFNLFPSDSVIKKLVTLGFSINVIVLLFSFLLSFGKRLNKLILKVGINFLSKIKIIKNSEMVSNKLDDYLTKFHQNALLLLKNKKKLIFLIFLNILALISLYSIAFSICMGMGININYITAIVTIAYVMMIGSFIPIPGASGGIEYGYMHFFGYFATGGLLPASMLIWRFVSYYLAMILGAIALAIYRKKEKICE